MAESISVPTWEYHDKNIQSNIDTSDFTRADRVIIFAAPTPTVGQTQVSMKPVGMIQSFTHSEQKQIQQLFELGSSVQTLVPGLTTGNISLSRVMLNGKDLLNAIYHGPENNNIPEGDIIRSIRDITRPFDILMARYPVLDAEIGATALSTTLFRGCHFQSRSESISAGGVVSFEQLSILYQFIPKVTIK